MGLSTSKKTQKEAAELLYAATMMERELDFSRLVERSLKDMQKYPVLFGKDTLEDNIQKRVRSIGNVIYDYYVQTLPIESQDAWL